MMALLKKIPMALVGAALAFGLVTTQTTAQQNQEKLGDFTDWSAYRLVQGGAQVCFMATQPKRSEGKYSKRGEVFFLVTHRPGLKIANENSFVAGYNFKENSRVNVTIDRNKTFSFFTAGDSAWALDRDDRDLVNAMVKGSNMIVKGTSWRGTLTTDTFSLSGFTKAYRTISKACDVKT